MPPLSEAEGDIVERLMREKLEHRCCVVAHPVELGRLRWAAHENPVWRAGTAEFERRVDDVVRGYRTRAALLDP